MTPRNPTSPKKGIARPVLREGAKAKVLRQRNAPSFGPGSRKPVPRKTDFRTPATTRPKATVQKTERLVQDTRNDSGSLEPISKPGNGRPKKTPRNGFRAGGGERAQSRLPGAGQAKSKGSIVTGKLTKILKSSIGEKARATVYRRRLVDIIQGMREDGSAASTLAHLMDDLVKAAGMLNAIRHAPDAKEEQARTVPGR